MPISPQDIEKQKKIIKQQTINSLASNMESYIDSMLIYGYRNILLDKEVDNSIPLSFTKYLNKYEELSDIIYKSYIRVGWKVKFGSNYRYIILLE